MSITKDEAKKFESPYFSMNVGQSSQLVITGWKIEERTFENKPKSPKLIMQVVSADNEPINKEWETGNRQLINMLLPMMFSAQEHNKASLVVLVMQPKLNEYHVTKLQEV